MTSDRKAINMQAVSNGRDLLAELAEGRKLVEQQIRREIAAQVSNVILKPEDYYSPPRGDH